ncbi:MAG: hypothetical protein GY841_16105 [FCB group bacterium]|nr:hypothetical protein [FCB group bacterium]
MRNANSREIIKVSITNSSAADGLDVQRGQDGSTATTFPRGSVIYQAITATNWEAFYQMGDYTALASTTDASTYFGENRYDSTATKWYKSTSATGTTWVATCT